MSNGVKRDTNYLKLIYKYVKEFGMVRVTFSIEVVMFKHYIIDY